LRPCSIGARRHDLQARRRDQPFCHARPRSVLHLHARRPGESLRLSNEAIAEAALLSPRTVGRAIRRLANLGIITVQGGSVYEITPQGTSAAEPQTTR
jgi:hypothetical protein